MNNLEQLSLPPRRSSRWIAPAIITLVTLSAYANSLNVPLHFDDVTAVDDNPTIKRLWPLTGPLSPPANGSGVHGRPLVNLSLAINYALSGRDTGSYHGFNLLLHIGTALLLFGVVRRTLQRASLAPLQGRANQDPVIAATIIAALWSIHPLLTESVTCVIQRTELMVGFFYLLVFYTFIRALDSSRRRWWLTGSIVACLSGAASKEVTVTAPVVLLLYDRTFVAGSFTAAWRRRRNVYLGLFSSWLLLAGLMAAAPHRGGTVGFGLGVSAWDYLVTQCAAIVLYLKLSFWPDPLVMDYGTWVAPGLHAVWWQATLLVALAAATCLAVSRWPRVGFLGFWFFAILAPSSSIVPLVSQTIAEHRMYLPLAAVIVLVVTTAARLVSVRGLVAGAVAIAVAFAAGTFRRNIVYQSEASLWADTLSRRPENARAHNNLGVVCDRAGRHEDAVTHYRNSLRLDNRVAQTHCNLGLALTQLGRVDDAIRSFEAALFINPDYPAARRNLGNLLTKTGRPADAIPHLQRAAEMQPTLPEIHFQLGVAFGKLQRQPEAIAAYRMACQLDPQHVEALTNLGSVLLDQGEIDGAIARFQAALRVRDDLPDVHFNLGLAEALKGDLSAAILHYQAAIRYDAGHVDALLNLGIARGQQGNISAAIEP